MRVVHCSDFHSMESHIKVPECELLLCTGDYGKGRTTLEEMINFIHWLHEQPAKQKVMIAGNHDMTLSRKLPSALDTDAVVRMLHLQKYQAVMANLEQYPDIKYLEDETFVYEGLKIHGMPWSPEFHPDNWVFNANPEQMIKALGKVPSDVNILLSHGPAYGYQDLIPQQYQRHPKEDLHRGSPEITSVIHRRLKKLKLFAFGHIHNSTYPGTTGADNYGIRMVRVTNTRSVLFSNGAVVDNDYNVVNKNPFIINL